MKQVGAILTNNTANEDFGLGLAISGNGLVMAASSTSTTDSYHRVKIYDRSGTSWVYRTQITRPFANAGNTFGRGLALDYDGDVIAIGDDSYAWVKTYTWNGSSFALQSTIDVSATYPWSYFGVSVALSDNGLILVVGASLYNGNTTYTGAVMTYDWSGSAWVQRGSALVASDAANNDYFGSGVSLSSDGSVLVVGAHQWEGAYSNMGGVYIYDYSGGSWVQRGSVLTASDAAVGDYFGYSVALSATATTLAVGAMSWEGSLANMGSVYFFTWNGSAWVQSSIIYLTSGITGRTQQVNFGRNLGLSKDGLVMVVSEYYETKGGVYTYEPMRIVGSVPLSLLPASSTLRTGSKAIAGAVPLVVLPLSTTKRRYGNLATTVIGINSSIVTQASVNNTLVDSVVLSTLLKIDNLAYIVDSLVLDESLASQATVKNTLQEVLRLTANMVTGLRLSINESLSVNTTLLAVVKKIARIIDKLIVSSSITTQLTAIATLQELLSLTGQMLTVACANINESLVLSSSVALLQRLIGKAVDSLAINTSITANVVKLVVLNDRVTVNDDAVSLVEFYGLIEDDFLLSVTHSPDLTNTYRAYVLNTENQAVSMYSHFDFNSGAKFNGQYLFANQYGLFAFGGDTDDSKAITAQITTAMMDMDSSLHKRLPEIYLGGDIKAGVILKVIVDGKTNVYQLKNYQHGVRTHKVEIGRGIKGRYFQFELITSQTDFDLESITFNPLVLSRSI